ncbi:MAG: hypothetical protein ACREOW_12720 [Thermodesulfobacteriota bacterium]
MKKITIIIILYFMIFPSLATADLIHGLITVEETNDEEENEEPDNTNQTAIVRIVCGDENKKTTISIPGTYRLTMNNEGSCTLALSYRQKTMQVNIISTDQPMRLDFAIVEEDGRYSLERR